MTTSAKKTIIPSDEQRRSFRFSRRDERIFDFSEMDLWWLLNRKKRENAQHGKVYFYEPSKGNEVKHSLLDTYGAEIIDLKFRTEPVNYQNFYTFAIEDIQKKCGKMQNRVLFDHTEDLLHKGELIW